MHWTGKLIVACGPRLAHGLAERGSPATLDLTSAAEITIMIRFCLTPVALTILSLLVWSPAARAGTTLTYHADGTSTMITNNGDEFDRITEFDAKGKVTKITWGEIYCDMGGRRIPKPKKIVVYNPDGTVASQTGTLLGPEPPPPAGKRKWRESETHDRNEKYAPIDKDAPKDKELYQGLIDNVIFDKTWSQPPKKPLRRTPGRTYSGDSEDPEPPPRGKREWLPGETHDRNQRYAPDDKCHDQGRYDQKVKNQNGKLIPGRTDSTVLPPQGQLGFPQGSKPASGGRKDVRK